MNSAQSDAAASESTLDPVARRALLGLAGLAGAATIARVAAAGPLNPPAGPIVSTGKTLTEVSPRTAITAANTPGDNTAVFVISQPGSYYLTDNLIVPNNKAGIRIAASGVAVDLNGFRMAGLFDTASTAVSDGGAALTNIQVRSGIILSMDGPGISLGATTGAILEDIAVVGGRGPGVVVGNQARLSGIRADSNGQSGVNPAGIRTGDNALVIACSAKANTGPGISVGAGSRVEGCLAANNSNHGLAALVGSVATACISNDNGLSGISGFSVVESCAVSGNHSSGISSDVPARAAIAGCTSRANQGTGIAAFAAAAISECASSLSVSTPLTAHGYDIGASSSITDSAAYTNAGSGIVAGVGSRVDRCTSRRHSLDGIVAAGSCSVVNNNCSENGQAGPNTAGIRTTGASNRIEGNLCTGGSGYGIWVQAAGALLLRNACSLNTTNWNLFTNCAYGPIVDRTSPGTPAMLGNGTTPSTMGTTDPLANFSF